jgi:hypothetical protein
MRLIFGRTKNGSVLFLFFVFIYYPCKLILTKLMDKCYKLNPTFQVCYGFHQLLVNIFIYPAISTFAVQICYTNKFLLYS